MKVDDIRFLVDLCKVNASRSKDPSTKVGAVIFRPDLTIATMGRNGFPKGSDDASHLYADREYKLCHIIHAELNAILFAREPLLGYGLCVWPLPPCDRCMAAILQAGIKHIVCPVLEIGHRWYQAGEAAKIQGAKHGVIYHEYREDQL